MEVRTRTRILTRERQTEKNLPNVILSSTLGGMRVVMESGTRFKMLSGLCSRTIMSRSIEGVGVGPPHYHAHQVPRNIQAVKSSPQTSFLEGLPAGLSAMRTMRNTPSLRPVSAVLI